MDFVRIALAGAVATAAIDVWALALNRLFKLPVTNWGMVGRWFGHMPSGTFVHRPIGKAPAVANEHAIGWTVHYLIGLIYAFAYFGAILPALQRQPSLASALAFGLATIVFPWLVLQPGLGLGVFAHRTDKPNVIRAINISIHLIFGAALYGSWAASAPLTALLQPLS